MKIFKKIGIKLQLAFILVAGVIGALLFFHIRNNIRVKNQMKYQLKRVKKETELLELEKDSKEKNKKLESLKEEEEVLKEKINFLEEKESQGEEVSFEELEDFFGERGF